MCLLLQQGPVRLVAMLDHSKVVTSKLGSNVGGHTSALSRCMNYQLSCHATQDLSTIVVSHEGIGFLNPCAMRLLSSQLAVENKGT